MSYPFNAEEILEMAEQIERNGSRFYRRAAEGNMDSKKRQLLLDLAAMEDDHERVFVSMRADLSRENREETAFDPEGQAALYLRSIADEHVFDVKADPAELLGGDETPADILVIAIGMEKDSIAFYLGMKELVPERLGKDRIDGIIKEEMSHLASLSRELSEVRRDLM
jgi:rubrerythrin